MLIWNRNSGKKKKKKTNSIHIVLDFRILKKKKKTNLGFTLTFLKK